MNARMKWHRDLVLCAMKRAGKPVKADADLLELVTSLGLEANATPEDLADLTCKKLSASLRGLEKSGRVAASSAHDGRHGRLVPTYALAGSFEVSMEPPPLPRGNSEQLQVMGLRQGAALAKRVNAGRSDPQRAKWDKLFRDMANDSATTMLSIQGQIAAFVARYEKRYQTLVKEAGE